MNKFLLASMVLGLWALAGCDGTPGGWPPLSPADIAWPEPECAADQRCGS